MPVALSLQPPHPPGLPLDDGILQGLPVQAQSRLYSFILQALQSHGSDPTSSVQLILESWGPFSTSVWEIGHSWCLSSIQAPRRQNQLMIAKSLQSCLTLCDPIDGSPPGSPVPGVLQARTLEWVAISFSSAWKWKVKVKSLSCVRPSATPWTAAYQAPPFIWDFPGKSTGVGCHCLLS